MDELKQKSEGLDSLLEDIGFTGGGTGALKFGTGIAKSMALRGAGEAALSQGLAIRGAKGLEATSLRTRGQLEKGRAQREAIGEGDIGALVESALIARAAAGGGASDPGVIKLASDIAAEVDFRKRSAIAEGDILPIGNASLVKEGRSVPNTMRRTPGNPYQY